MTDTRFPKTRAIVNNNGDTLRTLTEQHLEIKRCAEALLNALNASHPHGRNYQVNPDPTGDHRADVDTLVAMCRQVEAIRESAYDSAISLNAKA